MKQKFSFFYPASCKDKGSIPLFHFLRVCCIVICAMFSTNALAQTFPPPSACSSGDLLLVSAVLPPNAGEDACGTCAAGSTITRTLYLSINNKTGSTRTSFAFWGTLEIINPDGTIFSTEQINRCRGNITKNSINTVNFGTLSYPCGKSLRLTNLYLAWTSASPGETCPVLEASPSTINPKCGVLPLIQIVAGLDANMVVTDATCTAGGSIAVSPFGGKAPYSVTVNGITRSVPTGGTTTFINLPAANYPITITDATTPVACSTSKSREVKSASPITTDAGAGFTKTCTANTSGGTIGPAAESGYSYSWSSVPAGFTSTSVQPTVNPLVTTTYTLRKTFTATGCYDDDDVTVTVNTAAVTANAGNDFTKTCTEHTSGGFIGVDAEPGYTYSWTSSPEGFTSTAAKPEVNPSGTTTYTLRKTFTETGCFDDDDVTVSVNNATVTANAGDDFSKTCIEKTSGGRIGEVEESGYTYSWTSVPAGFTSTAANPSVDPAVTTTYTVIKTFTASGCFDDDAVTVTVTNATVTANAGNDFTKTCTSNISGGTIGVAAVGGYTYSWSSVPAGFTSTSANPSVDPAVTTTYTVRKTFTASGCYDDDDVTVTVTNATVTANAGNDFTKTCTENMSGGTIGAVADEGYTYSWSAVPAGFTSTSANPSVDPSVTTTYTVRKTFTASGCFDDDDVTVTVTNATVTANAGNDFTKTCIANTSGGTIGVALESGYTYSWTSVPAGFISTSANPSVDPSVTTTYTLRKTFTASGCFDDDEVTVTVTNAIVTANAGNDFTKTCIANTSGGTIGVAAEQGYTYSWSSVPAGFTSIAANPSVNPSATTMYTVRKTFTASGCYDDDDVTVTVTNATVTANAGNDFTKTCIANTSGGTIGVVAESGFTYSWTSVPAGFTSTSANPSVDPSITTTYTVRKTFTASGCYDDDDVTVTVNNAIVTANAGNDFTKTCTANTSGGTIGVVAESGFTYSWTSAPAGFTSASANPSVNPSATTTYTVRKTFTTSGCYDDDDVTVTVSNTPPAAPTFCAVQPALCGPATGSITIRTPLGSEYNYTVNNGTNWQAGTSFTNLAAGSVTGIKVKNINTGCVSDAANCSSSDCSSGLKAVTKTESFTEEQAAKASISQPTEEAASLRGIETITARLDSKTLASAGPNPFSDKIRFALHSGISGKGSLELYNMMGQKVKTVFEGYVEAGKSRNIEYNVPVSQRTTLMWVFTVGEQKVSGKLIGIR